MRAPSRHAAVGRHRSAFTLVEVLIALLVLTLCLFLALGLHLQQRRILSRLQAQGEALRALEGTIEALRAGRRRVGNGAGAFASDVTASR